MLIPNGYFKLQPFFYDMTRFVQTHGAGFTLAQILPAYGQALYARYGWSLAGAALGLAGVFLYGHIAAKTLTTLLTRGLVRLGFGSAAAGESHLLHAEGGAHG